jgi:hypothetical protein
LKIKVFVYIKNEGANLDEMTTLLKIVVSFKSWDWRSLCKAHVLGMPY